MPVNGTNSLLNSYDGINWSLITGTIFGTLCYSATWNGSMWLGGGLSNNIGYSYDGFNWTKITSVSNILSTCYDVASRKTSFLGQSPFGNRAPTGAYKAIQYGSGTTSAGTLAVTFGYSFSTVPVVTVTPTTGSTSAFITTTSITVSGFTARTYNSSGSAVAATFNWMAIA